MMKCWLTTMTVLATSLWTVADFSNTHLYPWKPLGSIRGSALVTQTYFINTKQSSQAGNTALWARVVTA